MGKKGYEGGIKNLQQCPTSGGTATVGSEQQLHLCIPISNGQQRKRIMCRVGIGGGNGVPPGGTDTRLIMVVSYPGRGGGEKGSWRKL